eukprot:CAMPEP_0170621932 /NCGR_PEP_ID=MMETSP0224-20130122/28860_1 /TAXON_ID=285029 /ORGANISM="Togula jolla, Strain CCCM 725" /LENGTH=90 /DNA_ID=CAMNT_0010948215 /DNA_START=86 /DNA_END=355 /DNA_ORIENTATION=+
MTLVRVLILIGAIAVTAQGALFTKPELSDVAASGKISPLQTMANDPVYGRRQFEQELKAPFLARGLGNEPLLEGVVPSNDTTGRTLIVDG